MLYKLGKNIDVTFWLLIEKVTRNRTVFAPRRHFLNEISNEPATCLSGKLSCNWLIMLVTMATPISSHVKDKNNIFTARDEDDFFVTGKILVFHQYLYNKKALVAATTQVIWLSACITHWSYLGIMFVMTRVHCSKHYAYCVGTSNMLWTIIWNSFFTPFLQ